MATLADPITNNGISDHQRRQNGKQLLGRVEPAFRDLVKEALDQGALLRAGHGKHPMSVVCPDGERLTLSQSTSDWRARKNVTAFLRRHGLEIGPTRKHPKRPGWQPPNARAAHERAESWLVLQPEDREFTAHDMARELEKMDAGHVMAIYLQPWARSGKIHFVRYTRNPGQRGIGTKVFSRRKPLSGADAYEAVMHVLASEAKIDKVLDQIVDPDAAAAAFYEDPANLEPAGPAVHLNGHAAASVEAAVAPEPSVRAQMWGHVADALMSLAQAAELAARLA